MSAHSVVKSIIGPVIEIESFDSLPEVNEIVIHKAQPHLRFLVVKSGMDPKRHTFFTLSLTNNANIKRGDLLLHTGKTLTVTFSADMMGKIIDPFGNIEEIIEENTTKKLAVESTNSSSKTEIEALSTMPKHTEGDQNHDILETGIKAIDLYAPVVKGGKTGIFGGAGVGKSILLEEILRNVVNKDLGDTFSVYSGVGERTREGYELYKNMQNSDIIDKIAFVFGNMGENPAIRYVSAYTAVSVGEYIRDVLDKNVLFFIDNMFRYSQAGNELSLMMSNIPSEGGYQSSLLTEIASIHERLTSSQKRHLTTIEAIYVPADDILDLSVQTIYGFLDSSIFLSRDIYQEGRYPAVDLISSNSTILNPEAVSPLHFYVSTESRALLKKSQALDRTVSLVGESELSEKDYLIYQRAKKIKNYLTQSFFTIENQTGKKGVYVPLESTIKDVKAIIDGEYDDISEDKFLFIGSLEGVKK